MPTTKLPKTIGAVSDLLFTTRAKRYEIQQEVRKLEETEAACKQFLIENVSKSESTGAVGKLAISRVLTEQIPTLADPDKFYAYLGKTKQYDLLQRRLNTAAITARWAEGKVVPGVDSFTVIKVSCTAR